VENAAQRIGLLFNMPQEVTAMGQVRHTQNWISALIKYDDIMRIK
jgi:hypothetical protein